MTSADQPPNPYRREDSHEESDGAPSGPGFDQPPGSPYGSWQSEYPYGSKQPDSPYGSSQPDSPYGGYPNMPSYTDEQPYAGGPVYGESPYEGSPYQANFGGSTPYGMASYSAPPVQHPQATLALILGILGLAVCPFVGIAALVIGNKARKQIDAAPGQFAGRGMATAGFVMGIASVAITVLMVLLVILGIAGALGT
jgi:hypothetical protein